MRRMFSEKQIENIVNNSPLAQSVEQLKNGTLPFVKWNEDYTIQDLLDRFGENINDYYIGSYGTDDGAYLKLLIIYVSNGYATITGFEIAYSGHIQYIMSDSEYLVTELFDNVGFDQEVIKTLGLPNNTSDIANKGYVDSNKGTKLYKHSITINSSVAFQSITIIDNYPNKYKDYSGTTTLSPECLKVTLSGYGPGTNATTGIGENAQIIYMGVLKFYIYNIINYDQSPTYSSSINFNLSDISSEEVVAL